MTIEIIDRSRLLDNGTCQLAERRLLFALSRFDSRIKQVDLVIEDENGPRGGIDKSCRISISLHRAADVVISDKDTDVIKCISRAAERGSRAVARSIARSNDIEHLRPT